MTEAEEGARALAMERAVAAAKAAINVEDHDLLVQTHSMVTTLHKTILGNGQPGLLKDVATLQAEMVIVKQDVPSKAERRTTVGTAVGVLGLIAAVVAKMMGLPSPI